MADTEHEVEIRHNLDEYAAKIQETNKLWDEHYTKVKAVNAEMEKMASLARHPSGAPGFGSPASSQDQTLDREYKRAMIPYTRAYLPLLKAGGGIAAGVARGGMSMAFGGGLTGLGAAIGPEIKRALSVSLTDNMLGGAAFAVAARPKSTGAIATGEGVEAIEKGAAEGVGFGLIKAFSALGPLAKLGITAIVTAAAVDIAAMEKSSTDAYTRSRRAGGYGANLGSLTAFDTTMDRFVDTGAAMASMAQAKYDFTSPQYLALKLAGINPKGRDTADLAEDTIMAVQKQLKGFSEDRMLPLAHAKFGNLFSDEEYIRLYTAREGEVKSMHDLAQEHEKALDMTEYQQRAYKDLVTHTDLAGTELRALGEDIMTKQIPAFNELVNTITKLSETFIADYQLDDTGVTGNALGGRGAGGGTGGGDGHSWTGPGAPPSVRSRGTGPALTGDISFPRGGRSGYARTGSAGFGLYATDVGLAANKNLNAMDRAFLDTFATGETPSGNYANVDHDPGGLGGRYQFLKSSWITWARKSGHDPKDFSAMNQDEAALLYASTLVRQKTGKDLDTLLSSGPQGVSQAIGAISPGAWNAITNIDRDKRGHSGGVSLFFDKLKKEEAATGDVKKEQAATGDAVKKAAGPPIPRTMTNFGTLDDAEKAKEKAAGSGPQSLNDLRIYQMEMTPKLHIKNDAGANVNVQMAMLGAQQGSFT